MVVKAWIPSTQKAKAEDHTFENSLNRIVSPLL